MRNFCQILRQMQIIMYGRFKLHEFHGSGHHICDPNKPTTAFPNTRSPIYRIFLLLSPYESPFVDLPSQYSPSLCLERPSEEGGGGGGGGQTAAADVASPPPPPAPACPPALERTTWKHAFRDFWGAVAVIPR